MNDQLPAGQHQLWPVGLLHEHPQNPRQGDVGAIIESIKAHGWYGTLVANKDGTVLAGNHRLKAARELQMESVPVYWVDVDDETALRILLADNRTSDLASWDDHALAGMLTDLQQQTTRRLVGTGWDDSDILDVISHIVTPAIRTEQTCPNCGAPFTKIGRK